MLRCIPVVDLIAHLTVLADRAVTMRETFRYQYGLRHIFGKQDAFPLPQRRRTGPEIHEHVEYLTTDTLHQLRFGMRRELEVQTPNDARPVIPGPVLLDPFTMQARAPHDITVVCTHE